MPRYSCLTDTGEKIVKVGGFLWNIRKMGHRHRTKRRVRYKGKYPKKFEEKYKELQPEKYQDTVEHVIP